ncbi:hypothetical protein LXA43DRAFT_1040049 [Ganoderma leucocontextum]|nr:hypothetical protein LXA43DRAFT_1040049 [Ganoderma leucocontextum]
MFDDELTCDVECHGCDRVVTKDIGLGLVMNINRRAMCQMLYRRRIPVCCVAKYSACLPQSQTLLLIDSPSNAPVNRAQLLKSQAVSRSCSLSSHKPSHKRLQARGCVSGCFRSRRPSRPEQTARISTQRRSVSESALRKDPLLLSLMKGKARNREVRNPYMVMNRHHPGQRKWQWFVRGRLEGLPLRRLDPGSVAASPSSCVVGHWNKYHHCISNAPR